LEASATYRNIRAVLLAGGVGGARMARGLNAVLAPENLTVVVNVGDDDSMYGALVSADLDTVMYTLAAIEGPHGWGIAADTHVVMDHLSTLGVGTTFRLGDRDLAHCLARRMAIEAGTTLSTFTRDATTRLGIGCRILPASDDLIRTKIVTDGALLDFQDYFVVRGQRDPVRGLEFRGSATARPAPGVLEAIRSADIVAVAPSNPPLSIWPMLAMADLAEAVRRHPLVVAVSPLIGGKAVKGPLVAVLDGLGIEPSTAGILETYRGLLSHLVVDNEDPPPADLDTGGVEVIATSTLISDPAAAARLARTILDLAPAKTPASE
jgi:LPPG:FO 2-phospho-L-lactate transferase